MDTSLRSIWQGVIFVDCHAVQARLAMTKNRLSIIYHSAGG
ncbi:hypothetical protein [Helicobacter sp. T3_23-1059]